MCVRSTAGCRLGPVPSPKTATTDMTGVSFFMPLPITKQLHWMEVSHVGKRTLTRIRRHRHAGPGHTLDSSSIGMILSVEALEVKKKTFLINLVQLQAHLYLRTPNTVTTIISASLSINTASISANGVDLSPIPSVGRYVGLCVCPESVPWQNGWLDPDAVWDGEWGRSRDGCITLGGNCRRGRGSFGVNLEHPIVNNEDFVA